MGSAIVLLALSCLVLQAPGRVIGVNVVLTGPPSEDSLAQLAGHGQIRDRLPSMNAVTLHATHNKWEKDTLGRGTAVTSVLLGLSCHGPRFAEGIICGSCAANSGGRGMSYPGAHPEVISAGAVGCVREWPADDPSSAALMLQKNPTVTLSRSASSGVCSRLPEGQVSPAEPSRSSIKLTEARPFRDGPPTMAAGTLNGSEKLDVAIVGAGVAGSSLAFCLARQGLKVAVFDKARFPRPKACGEGLLPQGVAALREMGLSPPSFPRLSGLRIVSRSGEVAEGVFPDGHGLAVRRDRFDAWLLDQAREAGVVVHEGQTLPKDIDARRIVAADGLHSSYGEGCADRPLRIGFSTRVSGLEAGDKVEIRFRKDGEVYLSPAGQDTLVVVLGRASRLRGQSRESVLARFLGGAAFERTAPILGMGPLGRTVRNVVSGEVALIGDAAGAPDPITGEGMSLALRSAIRLADAIRKADIQTYARWRLREGAKARRLGRRFLAIGRVSDRVVGSLNRRPDLMGVLMRVMTGAQDLTAVSIANWIRLFLT